MLRRRMVPLPSLLFGCVISYSSTHLDCHSANGHSGDCKTFVDAKGKGQSCIIVAILECLVLLL